MESFIYVTAVVLGFILFVYYIAASEDKSKKPIERMGDAISNMASDGADTISGLVLKATEPKNKRKRRLAEEDLATRNERIYRMRYDSLRESFKRYSIIDDSFRESLRELEISDEDWKKLALQLFYIGRITILSRDITDYSKRVSINQRKSIIENWPNNTNLAEEASVLKEALDYFGIKYEEWIQYGDAVVEMYDLKSSPLIRNYGIITKIKPMHNTFHMV